MPLGKGCNVAQPVRWLRFCAALAAFLGCGVLATGCDTSVARTPRMSELWSKGLPLGLASLNNRIALAVDESGSVYTVWVDLDHELRFVRLNDRANVVADRTLDLEVNRPQQPQLVLDPSGQVHVAWFNKREEELELLYSHLSADGEVLEPAKALSGPGLRAGRLAMVLEPVGRTVEFFWSDTATSRPGCYHAAVDWAGGVVLPEEMLIPNGLWPAAQVDRQGFVHLAWRVEPVGEDAEFHYAVYDPHLHELGPDAVAGKPLVQASLYGGPTAADDSSGPWMGLDEDSVYLAWVVEVRERGLLSAFTFYRAFPMPALDQPPGIEPFDYSIPPVEGRAVHVRAADPALTGDPFMLSGQPAHQVLACYTQAQGPRNLEMLQSAVVDVQEEQTAGLEVVSATPSASLQPSVAIDGRGYRHLVWIDTAGFERYRVLYASTAPAVQEALNPVTVGEVVSQTLELGFGAIALIGLLPLLLIWAIPAFFVVLIFYLVTQESDLDQPRAALGLWTAVLVHALVKLSTAGGVLNRLSTGGLLTTPWLFAMARWMVPLLITGLAALIMYLYGRLSGSRSLFASFFVFVLADAVLFSVVYLTPLLLLG